MKLNKVLYSNSGSDVCVLIISNLERDKQRLDLNSLTDVKARYVGIFPTKLVDLESDTIIADHSSILLNSKEELNLYQYRVPHLISIETRLEEKIGSLRIFDLGSLLLKPSESLDLVNEIVKILAVQGTEGELKFDAPLMHLLKDFFVGSCKSFVFLDVNSQKLDDDELQTLLTQSVNYRMIRKIRKMGELELEYKTHLADCGAKVVKFENETKQQKSEISKLTANLAEKESKLSELESKHELLQQECDTAKAQLEAELLVKDTGSKFNDFEYRVKLSNFRIQIANSKFETAKACGLIEQSKARLHLSQLESSVLQNGLKLSQKTAIELKNSLEKSLEQESALNGEHTKLKKEFKGMEVKMASLTTEKVALESKIEKLNTDHHKITGETTKNATNESTLKSKITELEMSNQSNQKELNELKAELKEKVQEIRTLEIQSAKLEAQLEVYKTNPFGLVEQV